MVNIGQLKRLRWAVRAVLTLGIAASVAANILHAEPNPISQTIAAWPPLALLLTVELVSRIPVHKPLLTAVRVTATAVIAGIAAWVSYWHMKDVAARFGETGESPYLIPVTVDGLIVVASVCLVELAGRIRSLEEKPAPAVEAKVVEESVAAVAPQSPGMPPVGDLAAGGQRVKGTSRRGRSGPQVVGASNGGLNGVALMEEPPKA